MTIRKTHPMMPEDPSLSVRRDGSGITEKLIKPWKLPPQRTYLFKNARVVDPNEHTAPPLTTVKLCEGLVDSIERNAFDSLAIDDNIEVVDLEGKYLCPGLIDCHVHLTAVAGDASLSGAITSADPAPSHFRQPYLCGQMLSRGFTTVRDTGGGTLALKEALADDVFPGPRLFTANKALSQTGGHGDTRGVHDVEECCGKVSGISVVVDGVPECIRAAREQLRTGGDFIKIMSGGGVASPTDRLENTQFTAKEVQAISEVAGSFGTWVTAHAYTPKAIRHAVDNGVTGIEHGNLMDKETAEYMAERKIWLTPTLITYSAMGSDKYAGFLPPVNRAKNEAVLKAGLESLRIAHEAGVTICHGSDLLGPLQAEQSREFELRAQALSSTTVLQGATVNAARMLRQESFLGQIKPGFAADMLILNKNPHDDVSILSRPEENVLAVIKNGRVYTSRWSKLPTDVRQSTLLIE
ncbi:amidohydrolase family protein [Sarocladium implicatum]|nr:amidohydrolase family protein [Sarocladium implicatum]